MIIEPSNPYNNIPIGIKTETIKKISGFATETRRRLLPLTQNAHLGQHIPLEVIFDPQPRVLTPPQGVPVPLVDIGGGVPYTHPNLIVRRAAAFSPTEIEDMKRRIQQSVVTKIQALTAAPKPGTSCLDVQSMVTDLVDRTVRGGEKMGWTGSSEREEDFDLTFIIPFSIDGCDMSCRISFRK